MKLRSAMRMCAVAAVLAAATAVAADETAYVQSVEQWHARRMESLKKPDGWLSYAGSGIVDEGANRVGSAPDNDLVLPKGPAHLGTLTLAGDGTLHFRSEPGGEARIDGKPFDEAKLATNADGATPTKITFGKTWFYVVKTGDRYGWRFRDPDSPLRTGFTGIDTFPIDPSWRIVADWQPYDPPHDIELVTVIGTLEPGKVPGKATFERDGVRYSLDPVADDDGSLFFIFADRTSGKETYGGARFLGAEAPKDGKVVLDFNKAYNPPCALSPHVVCPTAPAENRLGLRITAGEKKFAHH
jgi:uncharacterized protein (DUF1684 family)